MSDDSDYVVGRGHRIPTPRRLPDPLPELERELERELVATAEDLTIHYLPCNRVATIPAGTVVELVGYSERTGLPRIACPEYGVTDAIVDFDSLDLNVRSES